MQSKNMFAWLVIPRKKSITEIACTGLEQSSIDVYFYCVQQKDYKDNLYFIMPHPSLLSA